MRCSLLPRWDRAINRPAANLWGFHKLRVVRVSGLSLAAAVAFVTCVVTGKRIDASASASTSIADKYVETASSAEFDAFLDRLMSAESGGLANAKNPRSTALGPFQFIKSTFLEITRRHFQADIAGLSEDQVLARRTDQDLSRRAAAVFCKDSARYLKEQGLAPTFAHLRLAYLLGPADAARVIQAQQQTPVVRLLSPAVIKANPFMRPMQAGDLLAKSERDVSREPADPRTVRVASTPVQARQTRVVRVGGRCNEKWSSCRKFHAQKASKVKRRG